MGFFIFTIKFKYFFKKSLFLTLKVLKMHQIK